MERREGAKVFVTDASDRVKGVNKLMHEFDIATEGTVALKANYNSDDPFPATTHPETLRALIEGIKSMGAGEIVMAERSGMGRTRTVLRNRGVTDLSRKLGFKLIDLDAMASEGWKDIKGDGLHWKNGFLIARLFPEADKVVSTCCLKTHRFGGQFTISLKNSVGLIAARSPGINYDYMEELHTSPFQRLMIAEINRFYSTDLVLMDAAQGFVRGGPERGELAEPRVLLASKDRVAIDAAGVALLRHYGTTPEVMRGKIFDLEQIARASRLGVGIASQDQIDLIPLDDRGQRACDIIKNVLESQG